MTEEEYNASANLIDDMRDEIKASGVLDKWTLTIEESRALETIPPDAFARVQAIIDSYRTSEDSDIRRAITAKAMAQVALHRPQYIKAIREGWRLGTLT